ncbi:MAG: nucleotidyltransferase [Anaerolineaceae bacterium]|nr:nucleotidyltransferase [Anaerolineaceae bacterium]
MSESEEPDVGRTGEAQFAPEQRELFARCLRALNEGGVPYLVAGAHAKHAYTGVWRDTKDLDLFLCAADLERVLDLLANEGLDTSVEYPHWLAKASNDDYFIDLIFGMGHGRIQVDESWFAHKRPIEVAGVETFLIPPEELFVSKAFVIERYRCDVADILHLVLSLKGELDWARVLDLLGNHRALVLVHLLLFDFVYPGRRDALPKELMQELFDEVQRRWQEPRLAAKAFRGLLLDPHSFVVDLDDWGYRDARELEPLVDEKSGELL